MPETNPSRPPRLIHELLACAVAVILCVVALVGVLKLHRADLSVPFQYEHDSFTNLMMIKTMVDCGWWMTNDHLGAPFRFEFHDYPMNPNVHFLLIKGLSLFTADPARLLNLYFLLTFPLVTLAAYAALRATGAGPPVAVVFAVLYAFLPYHLWRNEGHLFLAAYFMIPLLALLIAWLARGEGLFLLRKPDGRLGPRLTGWREVVAVLICLGCGLDFPYYSLFALLFLFAAGILAAVFQREWVVLCRGLTLVVLTGIGVTINLAPNFLYQWRHGPNPAGDHIATARPWTDCELYALKPIQMVLPAVNHRLRTFRALRDRYYASAPSPLSSNDSMALGFAGAVGLLVLLTALVWTHRLNSPSARVHHVTSVLTAAAFLVGGVGGFSVLPGLFGVTIVRCYDRLSIYIGFFALAALAYVVEAVLRRCWGSLLGRAIAYSLLGVVLVGGIIDQTGHTYIPPPAETRRVWDSDADFVARVEGSLSSGSMIFQLPYVSFCSYKNSAHKMLPYSHFRGYFHSRTLRWTFGAMHGRHADLVHAAVADRPIEASLAEMAYLGFAGVYVDRLGYSDNAVDLEKQLRRTLGSDPIVSDDGRLSFFPMHDYSERLRADCGEANWSARREAVLWRPLTQWGPGIWPEEQSDQGRWRWCGRRGEVTIYNPADHPQVMKLQFKARAALPGPARLAIRAPGVEEVVRIDLPGASYSREITVPPGRHAITFTCDGKDYIVPGRTIVFALVDAEVVPARDQLVAGAGEE